MAWEWEELEGIAGNPTEFGAELLADTVRAAGLRAAVQGPDVLSAGLGQWRVIVPRSEAAAAREAILAARRAAGETRLERCPGCGYDLAGLEAKTQCPECGKDLAAARSEAILWGIWHGSRPRPAGARVVTVMLVLGLAVCSAVGYAQMRLLPTSTGGTVPTLTVVAFLIITSVWWAAMIKWQGRTTERK